MNLFGISINHKTASIEIREALHLNKDEISGFINYLKNSIFQEGFILSTCNRTEVFGIPDKFAVHYKEIENHLLSYKPINNVTHTNFNIYYSCNAVKHIFRVASGIDSLMIGDSQILGQVKEAFEIAEENDFVGPVLKRLFDTTLKLGKRAIKETLIGEGAVTVSYASVQIIEKIFATLENKSALIIGAGETGELAAIHLKDRGIGEIAISNRTLERAENLADKVGGEIIQFKHIAENLHRFDIIISATSSENYILNFKEVSNAIKKRRGTPVCIMDIAVPRDIDPKVRELENVFYHDMDSLQVIVKQNLKKREKEIPKVEAIIDEEMNSFFSWYNTLEVVPTIKRVRDFFEEIRQDELKKIKHKVTEEDFEKLDDMTRRMIGRILHNPTIKLREIAESGTNVQEVTTHSMVLKELFGLKNGVPDIHPNNNGKEKVKF